MKSRSLDFFFLKKTMWILLNTNQSIYSKMMISIQFDPVSVLTVGNETFYGIDILTKLHDLCEHPQNNEMLMKARMVYNEVASVYLKTQVPKLQFSSTNSSATMPTKSILKVGYNITAVAIHQQPNHMTTVYETFITISIPLGYYAEIVPHDSLYPKGYIFANSVCVIDPDFTGTIKVPLIKINISSQELALPTVVGRFILKPNIIPHCSY